MRLGCCAYSYRDKLTSGEMTILGFLDECARLGFEGVEITSYYVQDTSLAALRQLKRECFVRGLEVTGVAVGTNYCQSSVEGRAKDLTTTRAWMAHGETLGAPFIRVFAGPVPEGDTEEAARTRCLAGLEEAIAHGEEHGIVVGLENHGGITGTAEQVLRIVEAVGPSPWFGINLDSGNFQRPAEEFPLVAPHTVTVHAKRSYHDPSGTRHEVDWADLRRTLEAAGYRGFLNMEYEEPEDATTGVPDFLRVLREVF
jgi:sugar phosphate isomerase/epimerase